ncbi:MAG: VOC family protein [Eubacteriales bacterium]|nr:VOC family protein [Eubacteriales bacterium]
MNRINIVCLGVKDMARSLRFYRDGLGFHTDDTQDDPDVVFFDTPGTKFELFPLDLLAKDINPDDPPTGSGFSGVTLAYNVAKREEVDEVIDLVRAAGGAIIKAPQDVFWGGYHAYFADPDGYCWEVAWGPNFEYDGDGMLKF